MSVNRNEDELFRKEVEAERLRRKRKRKIINTAILVLGAGCLLYFAGYVFMQKRTGKQTEEWAKIKQESAISNMPSASGNHSDEPVINKDSDEIIIPDVLPEYEILLNKNKSLIGWVKIADTNIDYPVMQTMDNEYYLNHDFNQKSDKNGCIFLDAACSVIPRSDNLIVYGHHMKSGAMFGQLNKYADESFFQKHPTFQFDTIYEKGVYRVAYVFQAQVMNEDEIGFKYYQFIDVNSEAEFQSNVLEMAKMSLYDTGITPQYGDTLVTLSTCDRSLSGEGRFVVVGVKE